MDIEIPLQDSDIALVVEQVTLALLGASSTSPSKVGRSENKETWTGCVMVEGPFRAAVTVACSRQFAQEIGAIMFDASPSSLSDEAARDALAEFTNIVGGNLKSLISTAAGETCQLCLPIVAEGLVQIPNALSQREVRVDCDRHTLSVSVFKLPTRPSDQPTPGRALDRT